MDFLNICRPLKNNKEKYGMTNTFCKTFPNLQLESNNIKLNNLSLCKSCNKGKNSKIKWQLFFHDFQRICNNIFHDFNSTGKIITQKCKKCDWSSIYRQIDRLFIAKKNIKTLTTCYKNKL